MNSLNENILHSFHYERRNIFLENKQFLDLVGLAEYDSLIKAFINGKIFVGTYEEYQTAYANGDIKIGCLVCITDDQTGSSGGSSGGSSDTSSTSAILGVAVLGQMVLA